MSASPGRCIHEQLAEEVEQANEPTTHEASKGTEGRGLFARDANNG